MKQIFLVVITVLSIIGCSKGDGTSELSEEDDVLNLSEIEQRLVGTWYPSEDYTGNTYTYNQDGTAVYVNEYAGELDVYEGFWEIVDGDVLIEFYPASNESIDGWQNDPHFKSKIELLDSDYTLKTTDFDDESRVETMYRECDPCPPRAKEFQIYISGSHNGQYNQYSLKTTYYTDDGDGELNSEIVDSNLFSGEYYTLTAYDKIGFKYETDIESEASVELIEIKDKNGKVIFLKNDFSIGIGETFMYEISKDSYSVN